MSILNKLHSGEGVANLVSQSQVSSELVDPRTVHRVSDPTDLVTLAEQVSRADDVVKWTATNKLMVIAEQIRHLQQQAKIVLEEAKNSSYLHRAACNFKKIPGKMYHLYARSDGSSYVSMVSPDEWGDSLPHKFLGSYQLEHDMSWTKAADIEKRRKDLEQISVFVNNKIPSIAYICDTEEVATNTK